MFKLPLTPATPVNEEQEQIIKAHERVVQQFRSRCVASNAPQFSWGAWGPNRTRWFNEFHSQDWQHAVFGTRAVETALRVNGKLMTGPRKSRKTVDEMIQEMLDKEEEEAGKPVERRVGKALVLRDFNPTVVRIPSSI
ncbi:hypothetical protein DL96DRAFT_1703593 [Flagelloscypha sp. PMI_526]|nr:hypothetical protein DL96DRAFT_1703593 [Flagelloscypha sp. PMI_526]